MPRVFVSVSVLVYIISNIFFIIKLKPGTAKKNAPIHPQNSEETQAAASGTLEH